MKLKPLLTLKIFSKFYLILVLCIVKTNTRKQIFFIEFLFIYNHTVCLVFLSFSVITRKSKKLILKSIFRLPKVVFCINMDCGTYLFEHVSSIFFIVKWSAYFKFMTITSDCSLPHFQVCGYGCHRLSLCIKDWFIVICRMLFCNYKFCSRVRLCSAYAIDLFKKSCT